MDIKKYTDRVAGREYNGDKITSKELSVITDVINNAPTSTNAQQFSAIIITNKDDLKWFSKKNWGQPHIAEAKAFILFVADRTRQNIAINGEQLKDEIKEHEQFRAVVDATIGATYAHDALMQNGYGVCFIGGVLTFADEIMDRLNLPTTTFPIVGVTFGVQANFNAFKPKINKVFMNKYDESRVQEDVKVYNEVMKEYYSKRKPGGEWVREQVSANGYGKKPGYVPFFKKGSENIKKFQKNFK